MAEKKSHKVPEIPTPPQPVEPPAEITRARQVAAQPHAVPVEPAAPVAAQPNVPPVGQSPYGQPGQPIPAQSNPYAPQAGYVQPNPYAPQGPYAQQPYAPGPPQGLSITSMVLGIVGLLLSFASWGFLLVVAAIITGHLAQRRQPAARALWITGLITGYIGLGISFIWGLFFAFALVVSFSGY